MVENSSDLARARTGTPVYTMRRTEVLQKYRMGENTAT